MNELLEKNRRNAAMFDEKLKDVSGIQLLSKNEKCKSAYWLYSIRVLNGKNKNLWKR